MFAWNIPLHPHFSYFMLFLLSVFWLMARALPRLETQQKSFFCQQTVCKYMKIFLSIPSELQPSFQGSAISSPWEIAADYMYVCMHACISHMKLIYTCIYIYTHYIHPTKGMFFPPKTQINSINRRIPYKFHLPAASNINPIYCRHMNAAISISLHVFQRRREATGQWHRRTGTWPPSSCRQWLPALGTHLRVIPSF